jgi:hypothetical protein
MGAENLTSTGIRSTDRPARIESLYRLSYRGPIRKYLLLLLLFSLALQPSAGYGLIVTRGFLITHNEAPISVGLLLDE